MTYGLTPFIDLLFCFVEAKAFLFFNWINSINLFVALEYCDFEVLSLIFSFSEIILWL